MNTVVCAMLLRCVYGQQAYDFFLFLYDAELNKTIEAILGDPYSPHETVPYCAAS